VKGRLVRRDRLGGVERDAMYRLLDEHFEGISRERFESDLEEKNWVLLLEEAGRLLGFSTLLLYESGDGAPFSVVYSGDTIVGRGAWGSMALPGSWIAAVRALWEREGRGRLFWLLLTSGFRTYRFLPVFWRDFHPRHDAPVPVAVRELLGRLAEERLGSAFRPETGIARFRSPQVLRADLRRIPIGRSADPHVTFFTQRNPGWVDGDELVCLTEIAVENLTPAGRRMWTHGQCEWENPRGDA